jgi:hypothetical protein
MSMIGNFRLARGPEIEHLLDRPDEIHRFLSEEGAEELTCCVDKAWAGLHYLLTGTAWGGSPPLNFICLGGREIDEDVGYGPPHAFSPPELKGIADALQPLTVEQLRSRFDGKAMTAAQVYPGVWDRPLEDDDTIGYLTEYFEELKRFLTGGAERGLGLVVWID